MSFGGTFPFSFQEEMDFITKCQNSVDLSNINPQHATPAYKLSEELPKLSNNPNDNNEKKQDRILIGLHPPDIPILPFTFKQIITKTKTIKLQNNNNNNTNNKMNNTFSEPPLKKPKLCDWRTGHNKPIGSNSNNSNNKSKLSKISNAVNKNSKNSKNEIKIPKGCEKLFDYETGELVEELADLDKKLVETIGYELLNNCENIKWNDVAGLEPEKEKIKEAVIWPLQRKDLFDGKTLLKPPKGVLLFGPPGTGKTMLAKAIASESKANFFIISPSSLQSKWIGESPKLVRTMFSVARFMSPSIVFIDECDLLLCKRASNSSSSSNASNGLKTQFLQEMQGAKTNNDGYVLIVGATNFPEVIDDAVRRRLSKRLYIPLPNKSGRKQLILNLLKKASTGYILNDEQINILVEKTQGYSGSDINDVAEEAAMGPLRDVGSWRTVDKKDIRPLEFKDFESALECTTPTVTEEDINKYKAWNDQFGAKLKKLK